MGSGDDLQTPYLYRGAAPLGDLRNATIDCSRLRQKADNAYRPAINQQMLISA